jgi:hypothetical protein
MTLSLVEFRATRTISADVAMVGGLDNDDGAPIPGYIYAGNSYIVHDRTPSRRWDFWTLIGSVEIGSNNLDELEAVVYNDALASGSLEVKKFQYIEIGAKPQPMSQEFMDENSALSRAISHELKLAYAAPALFQYLRAIAIKGDGTSRDYAATALLQLGFRD